MRETNCVHYTRVAIDAVRKAAEKRGIMCIIRNQGLMLEVANKTRGTSKEVEGLARQVLAELELPVSSEPHVEIRQGRAELFGSGWSSKRHFKRLAYSKLHVDSERPIEQRQFTRPAGQINVTPVQPHELARKLRDEELRPKGIEGAVQKYQALQLTISFSE